MIERQFIFFPDKRLLETPAHWGLDFEDVHFYAPDGIRLHGWYVPAKKSITWLWFHGNAGNISHRLENLKLIHDQLEVNVFLFDYRGYGRSEGNVSEDGTYHDADGALAYLFSRRDIDHSKIVLFGRSLGCAIAVELATKYHAYGLILESPFTSIHDMTKRAYPYLPIDQLIKTKYDSLSKISRVSTPLLVMHGDQDEVIPIELGMHLFNAANEPKEFFKVENAGHNDTYIVGGEGYLATLERFLKDLGSMGS